MLDPAKQNRLRFWWVSNKYQRRVLLSGHQSVQGYETQPLVLGHQAPESKDLLWVAMQGWKYWKNIKELNHDGLDHLEITDFPVIHMSLWKSCSLSFGEYYKSIKFDSSHPPLWGTSSRFVPQLSVALVSLGWNHSAFEHHSATSGNVGKEWDQLLTSPPQPQESLPDGFIIF